MFTYLAPAWHDTGATEACSGWALVTAEGRAVHTGAHSAVEKSAKAVTFALSGREFVSSVVYQPLPVTLGGGFPPKTVLTNEAGQCVDSVFRDDRAVP